ncbi:MAG: LytR/AlgR family response regulator transcription factor [Chitinophagales bacterium]
MNKALRKQIGEELFIMIRSEYKQEKIFLKDILFIEGMGDYRRLHTNRRKIMTLQTFKELESMLSESSIQRVHKSYMINVDNIVQRTSEYVMLTNGERIPISDSYKGNFK